MSVLTRPNPLAGRVAVIAGASSGIGEATALRVAELGAKVALLARRTDRIDALATKITEAGGTAIAITLDVTDRDAVHAVAARVATELGTADLVFNNAGVMLPAAVEEFAEDQWEHQVDLNIQGLLNVLAAFTPQLIDAASEGRPADLINTSSIAAKNIFPKFAVYSGTKAFVTHLSVTLRAELGQKGVRVSAVEPGMVITELETHIPDDAVREWFENSHDTMLHAEDIADVIAFTASLPSRANLQQVTVMPTAQAG